MTCSAKTGGMAGRGLALLQAARSASVTGPPFGLYPTVQTFGGAPSPQEEEGCQLPSTTRGTTPGYTESPQFGGVLGRWSVPDIRYVCLSDMHLGADGSLLTHLRDGSPDVDPTKPSAVLVELVKCLRDLISKNEDASRPPTLILNGDIPELALTTDNKAGMAFERFIELIAPADDKLLFDEHVVYIPGNHDHHLWETARETQYVHYVSTMTAPGEYLKVPWHATKMFGPDPVPSGFLNVMARRHGSFQIGAVYPNYGILSKSGQKCVVFSHGHFTESKYLLMSTLRTLVFPDREPPRLTWDYEAENFAWIDFFWSTLGRSGDVGNDVELVYNKLDDRRQVKVLVQNLVDGLIARFGKPLWPRWLQAKILGPIADLALGELAKMEKKVEGSPELPLSADGREGLQTYLEQPLRAQILLEHDETMPDYMTFVFGHTHKPFQQDMHFAGYPEPTSVYNSGGWVVETTAPEPQHGGAVILVDEYLDAVSLRLYNESRDAAQYAVSVAASNHGAGSPFFARVKSLVDPSKDPWKSLSQRVAAAVPVYERNLSAKMSSAV